MQTTINAKKGPQAERLALKLVQWNYGELCKLVIEALIKHGRQSLRELVFLSKLGPKDVQAALIVLIQHNCAVVHLHEGEHVYEAVMDVMLQMIRMPRFLEQVRRHFSGEPHAATCVAIVQTLLYHGRLSMGQLPAAVRTVAVGWQQSVKQEEGGGGDHSDEVAALGRIHEALRALVEGRYIERAWPCSLPPPPPSIHPNARKKKAQPKAGSEEEAKANEEANRLRQRMEYASTRFRLPDNVMAELLEGSVAADAPHGAGADAAADTDDDTDENDAAGGGGDEAVGAAAGAGGKRKRPAASSSPAHKRHASQAAGLTGPNGSSPSAAAQLHLKVEEGEEGCVGAKPAAPVPPAHAALFPGGSGLWRINFEAFNLRFRNVEITKLIAEQHGERDGRAVAALLEAMVAREAEGVGGDGHCSASLDQVTEVARRMYKEATTAEIHKLGQVLTALAEGSGLVLKTSQNMYIVLTSMVLDMVKTGQVLASIRHRFGSAAARIWNLLLLEGQLEQKAVADFAMVPKDEARQALYRMLQNGYLVLQDVPKGQDHAPSRTVYTWRASLPNAAARLAADLYRAAGNLLARHIAECEAEGPLLELVNLVSQGSMNQGQLDTRAVARLQIVLRTLEASLLRLDDQIAIFSDM